MKRLFTLAKPGSSTDKNVLNGKIFYVKVDPDTLKIAFVDVSTDEVLRVTTPILSKEYTDDGIIVRTKSGSTYELIDLYNIIPTKMSVTDKDDPEPNTNVPIDFVVVGINYDETVRRGEEKTTYVFSRGITKNEFASYLFKASRPVSSEGITLDGKDGDDTWIYRYAPKRNITASRIV